MKLDSQRAPVGGVLRVARPVGNVGIDPDESSEPIGVPLGRVEHFARPVARTDRRRGGGGRQGKAHALRVKTCDELGCTDLILKVARKTTQVRLGVDYVKAELR